MEIYKYPSYAAEEKLNKIINRDVGFSEKNIAVVTDIINNVKKNGDNALIEYSMRFDLCKLDRTSLTVSKKEMEEAKKLVSKDFLISLDTAIDKIKRFHTKQIEKSWIEADENGIITGQLVNPVNSAGIYVPGGKGGQTPLVSSVLMGALPAKIAGVKNIIMTTPPTKNGTVNPHLLAAANRVGIDSVFKVGSAWAVAAMAFGTETIRKVDVIAGPGNIYVTIAKKLVSGAVGIDMIAGPSEILIVADGFGSSEFAAADLLSQAEHDVKASAILITVSEKFAEDTTRALSLQIQKLTRKDIAEQSIKSYGAAFVVEDIETGIRLANLIAPEHLQLCLKNPFDYIGKIKNAGAVFIGEYTPEPVGDYIAGPNHVLPTAGAARFSSGLSVANFIKKTNLISYNRTAFNKEAKHIIKLASTEGLDAHINSINIRKGYKVTKI
ncbi:MAG: histidinol dehydrogenase [Deltaproteobacteria bacterium]|nr:histidinol dehydrogenase [Deltaproteobacteria bacterium]